MTAAPAVVDRATVTTSRGLRVAAIGDGLYDVIDPQGSGQPHRVTSQGDCDCRARQYRYRICKHIDAVAEYLRFAPLDWATIEELPPSIIDGDELPPDVVAAWDDVPAPDLDVDEPLDVPTDDEQSADVRVPVDGELAEPQPTMGGRATKDDAARSGFAATNPRFAAWSATRAPVATRDPRTAEDLLETIAHETGACVDHCVRSFAQIEGAMSPPTNIMRRWREARARLDAERRSA